MAKHTKTKGMEQQPIPIKKPDSNKQPSLISSTKGRYVYTSTQCGPIFIYNLAISKILINQSVGDLTKRDVDDWNLAKNNPAERRRTRHNSSVKKN